MRGRHVSLSESLQVGLSRFFPIIGLAFLMSLLGMLAALALIFPAFIVFTMWFVAMPVCIVERLGPWASMQRSADLTKGHRWKIFGLWILIILIVAVVMIVVGGIAGAAFAAGVRAIGGPIEIVFRLIWGALWGAFYAIMVVVTYHDLRVAKEGVDTYQIAAVFD